MGRRDQASRGRLVCKRWGGDRDQLDAMPSVPTARLWNEVFPKGIYCGLPTAFIPRHPSRMAMHAGHTCVADPGNVPES